MTHNEKLTFGHIRPKKFMRQSLRVRVVHEKEASTDVYSFPPKGPLNFVAMDIIVFLAKTPQEIQYVLVIMDRYIEVTRTIRTSKTTASNVSNLFLDHWIVPFEILTYFLTDTRPQLG